MWHRLPFAQKRKPAGYQPRVDGEPPRQRMDRDPGGLRDARRPARRASRSAGTTSSPALSVERAGVRDRAARRDQRALPGVRRRRRLSRSAVVAARGLGVGAARIGRAPAVLGARRRRWHWRGMFDLVPLPPAWPVYVSQAEASAYARWRGARLPTEAEFQRAAYGSPAGERVHPWGDAPPDATPRRLRFLELGSGSGRQPPARCERVGRRGSGRQRLGVDEHAVRAVSRVPRDGVVSRILGRFFRRRARGDERRLDGDGEGAAAADVPQLVPRPVSVCLCNLPLRDLSRPPDLREARREAAPIDSLAGDVQYYLDAVAAAAAVALSLRRARLGAVRGDLRAAVVPHHARGARAADAPRPRDPRRTPIRCRRWSSSGPAAATSSRP